MNLKGTGHGSRVKEESWSKRSVCGIVVGESWRKRKKILKQEAWVCANRKMEGGRFFIGLVVPTEKHLEIQSLGDGLPKKEK
mmetsp:Transcript_39240/g.81437  ORF Transcript_39240/g.81437 Transcript_39240/m.81437 type:complete len:82 (-) Transcript_39240:85-330(-)